eukprot:TRINITY_DN6093_c0_g1_i1.p1 TRINITY_DN6093_c0_g1~~TRINITY_DN6093_c0_g1_i1.p1  ORF type:complete len:281 (+),score=57.35 TRINITY_DN6093_c0_g1_i1:51-893(+)
MRRGHLGLVLVSCLTALAYRFLPLRVFAVPRSSTSGATRSLGMAGYTRSSSGDNDDASPVRLTYFAGYGLAEQTRWLLAAAGISWQQVALQTHEEFLALRQQGKLLFGQLPLLEIDGLRLVQSQAMLRYVAQRGNLWGSNPGESATVDMTAEGIKDARGVVVSFRFTPDQASLAAEVPSRIVKQMRALEAAVQRRADASLGFLPSGLSAADVLLAELVEELLNIRADAMTPYPNCAALHKQVVGLPNIQAYLKGPQRFPFPRGRGGQIYVQNVQAELNGP